MPKANENYALGQRKYEKLLQYGEMLTVDPDKLLQRE
jgi:hypothetical protein